MFENRILRRIFGIKGDDKGEWRTLRNGELQSLYSSLNIVMVINSRRLRWTGHITRIEEGRRAFKIVIGKPTGKRPLGKPRWSWQDNIRVDLKEIVFSTRYCVDSANDRDYWNALVNAVLDLRVP